MQKPEATERFFRAFDDATIFDCGQFNLLKVAQDALIREVGKSKTGKFSTYFNQPRGLLKLFFLLKNLLKKKSGAIDQARFRNKKILAVVPARFIADENGVSQLQYFGNLLPHLPQEKLTLMYLSSPENTPVKPDVHLREIKQQYDAEPPDTSEWVFLKSLNDCYQRICKEAHFSDTDLVHIKVAFDEFWRQFRVLNKFFSRNPFQKALLIPGYYTENLIAALRENQVEIIEIQHGVITPASHFYIYPARFTPVVKKSLFADRIWLFGNFWREQLLKGVEFKNEQIEILGDYFYREEIPPSAPERLALFSKKFRRRVLVGTQTKRHEQFIRLITGLSKKYAAQQPDCGIIVKFHPAEDPELYTSIQQLPNVLVTDGSLDFLYSRCEAYISMYSNTLFEATRFQNLKRFVLHTEETAELSEAIADSGVAEILHVDEDPLEKQPKSSENKSEYYFAPLNTALLKNLLTD